MLQLTKPLAFIDLETTGVNLATDRIIEIAIVKVLPDGKRSVKRKLIHPQMAIPKQSSDVHGITDEMNLVAACREFFPNLCRHNAAAPIRGIAGDANLHKGCPLPAKKLTGSSTANASLP